MTDENRLIHSSASFKCFISLKKKSLSNWRKRFIKNGKKKKKNQQQQQNKKQNKQTSKKRSFDKKLNIIISCSSNHIRFC